MNDRQALAGRDPKLVCVVDDDVAVLASYCALLESAGFAPVPYTSGAMLLADDRFRTCGCILLDLRMPPPDGLETLRLLRERGGRCPVIMITGEGDIPTAVEAMRRGAFDFAEKPVDDEVLIGMVEKAFAAPQPASGLAGAQPAANGPTPVDSLTAREKQVLSRLLDGATNKEIARDLGISHRTVEVHRANIMEKTGAGSLSRLVLMAADCRHLLE
jgi:two-component system response regulator FixJ